MSIQTSSTSSPPRWKYDIFLSFRGDDTRKTFTDHLYTALEYQGIITFRDDPELEKGKPISPELFSAIEESRFALIVLSQNYASSMWCLDELVRILKCMKGRDTVLPIFYNVDPSDVRKQTGSFREAFTKHEERFVVDKEKLQSWRSALTQVASFSGWNSKEYMYESKLIEDIIEVIWKKLKPTVLFSSEEKLVGIDSRLQPINLLLSAGEDDVRFIGIWGMGGIGKTTMVRVLHERISHKFELNFLLTNVSNSVEKGGLLNLQKQLLSEIWTRKDNILNPHEGAAIIRRLFGHKKVLLILDDVNDPSHLKYLAGNPDWFGSGSRVLITTRDEHLLVKHEVERKFKVEELNYDDSLKLFSWKAFKRDCPKKGFLCLSKSFVNYAQGLPLALEVLGSFLRGRDLSEWNSALSKLEKVCDPDIFKVLKISYDDLDYEQKKIFLDIACFFNGEDKDRVTEVLTSSNVSAIIGIQVLTERSLLTPSYGRLRMHDLLREMGREIVRQESLDEPSKRSRLWLPEDINYVLSKNTGTEAIEGIFVDSTNKSRVKVDVNTKSFSMMRKLRYLKINYGNLPNGLECLPNNLRILNWTGYPSKSLPPDFNPEKLLELNLRRSYIEHFNPRMETLYNLKIIDLSHSLNLLSTPNFRVMPYLELLTLEGCTRLYNVDSSVEVLSKLTVLNLKDCKNLVHFAGSVQGLRSLKVLNLSGCSKVNKLPNDLGHLESLKELDLSGTGIRELPSSIGMLERLPQLNLKDCRDLVHLPSSVGGLKSLKVLNLSGCSKLNKLPCELGHVDYLENLDVSKTGIRELPSLKNLKELSLRGCKGQSPKSWNPFQLLLKTSYIPRGLLLPSLSGLPSLTKLDLSDCNLFEVASDVGCLSSLRELHLSRNQFVGLPRSICQLSKLKILNMDGCRQLQTLSKLPSHVSVDVSNCISLDTLSNPIEQCNSALSAKCFNCFKMVKNESFKSIALSLLTRYLQVPKAYPGYDIFEFVAPGNEIPEWYNHQSEGSSIIVKLHPGWFSNKWMGFALCVVFGLLKPLPPLYETYIHCFLSANGKMLTIPHRLYYPILTLGGTTMHHPTVLDHNHIWLFYVDRVRDRYFHNNWQDIYYELEFSFFTNDEYVEVNKCGVHMLYEEEAKELRQTLWKQSNIGINTKRALEHSDDAASVGREEEEEPYPKRFKQLDFDEAGTSGSACIDDQEHKGFYICTSTTVVPYEQSPFNLED